MTRRKRFSIEVDVGELQGDLAMTSRFYQPDFDVGLRAVALCVLTMMAPSLMAQQSATKSVKKPVKAVAKSRMELKSTANQMATGIRAAEAALTPAELAIAQQVESGLIPCELGAFVTVAADAAMPGFFDVHGKKFRFRMVPVVTSTGAIRLEDARAGAVWLQLSNKSMLMNQKTGSRLADACVTSAQAVVAAAMEKAPPPGLLDGAVVETQSILLLPDPLPPSVVQ
jgi:hypothetical protein